MKKVELKDVKAYDAAKHFGMTAMRLHGKEETSWPEVLDGTFSFPSGRRG
jgi:hypothetical protein